MAQVTTFRCDECGKLKTDANHWFRAARLELQRFVIVGWDSTLSDFQNPGMDHLDELHLCGMECAHKAMAKALEG